MGDLPCLPLSLSTLSNVETEIFYEIISSDVRKHLNTQTGHPFYIRLSTISIEMLENCKPLISQIISWKRHFTSYLLYPKLHLKMT